MEYATGLPAARFRALLDDTSDAIVVAELPSLRVVDANRAGRALLDAGDAQGGERRLDAAFEDAEWRRVERAIARGTDGGVEPTELWGVAGGERRAYEVTLRITRLEDASYVALVARDVTGRARAERELREAKRAAELAARSRAEFLSIASRELRTPLAALQLLLELAEGRGATPEPIRRMRRPVERLRALVGDLLDVARLEGGRVRVVRRAVRLDDLAREAAEDAEPDAEARRVVVQAAGPVPVVADPGRVGQVLSNLLENALRFSPPGSPVEVRAWARSGIAHVAVTDHGPGIPPRDRGRLFTPFARLAGVGVGEPGLGLGLHVARQLARLHGGDVAHAPAPGGGAVFTLMLPQMQPAEDERREGAAPERERGG